eukprot:CAMPEP_0201720228 /NCGR_PEP_ID=MMETSP0593-20130828/5236_1 /ASSEMBLY_ACC=CAM_ASM_000672 /TAXON_ID=267983 /ORGANISM="Skeletonema japonicum, Strain CCMP2506" /LENGTH=78 /DNA_ID=CAMNT_0048210841 /DNA_START=1298 /DNA_END=1531 /DNA_ORIENTATION=+
MEYIDSICNASASILGSPEVIWTPEEGKVVLDYILDNCAKHPNRIFLTQPMGGDDVLNFTFSEFLTESKKMAAHIESL